MTLFGRVATQGPSRFVMTGGSRQNHGTFSSFTFTAGGSVSVSGRVVGPLGVDVFVVGGGGPGSPTGAFVPDGGKGGSYPNGTPGLGGSVSTVPRSVSQGTHPVTVGAASGTSTFTITGGTPVSSPGASRPDPASVANNYRTGSNQNYSGRLAVGGGSAAANTGTGGGGGQGGGAPNPGGAGGSGIVVVRVNRADVH